jgi:hypothetical protein
MTMYYEPGRYRCRVASQGWAEAKTGKTMIVFKVFPLARIIQGPEGPEDAYVDGKYDRTIRLVVNPESDKQMDCMMLKLRHAGFDGDSFAQLDLTDSEVECQCDPQEYNGKEVESWDLALPPLESKPPQMIDPKVARKLDALVGRRLKDGAAPKPQAQPVPTGASEEPPGDDSEVPF